MKYECTVIFDASSSVSVEADTPEEAAQLAEDMVQGNQTLCHQCSNDLNTGDSLGVHVYNEECTEELLDTTYRSPQRTWAGLSIFEINDLVQSTPYDEYHCLVEKTEALLKEKNT